MACNGVGVEVGKGVPVCVGVADGVNVGRGVLVRVGVGVGVGPAVIVGVGVSVGVEVGGTNGSRRASGITSTTSATVRCRRVAIPRCNRSVVL